MKLIIQGNATPALLTQVQALSGAVNVVQQAPYVWRLTGANDTLRSQVKALCDAARCDHAFVRGGLQLSEFKVLALDMDSTLINIECIDEIADFVGKKAEVAAITEAAMRGEITDFKESLTRRVALLKGVPESALHAVYEQRLRLHPGAESLLAAVQSAGLVTQLVSGGFTFFTERLKDRLKLDHAAANTLEVADGVLTGRVLGDIVDGNKKKDILQVLSVSINCTTTQCIAMGDGSNDLPMMSIAGLSVAYHAKPAVQAAAHVSFNHAGLDGVLQLFE
jgi:phosphoserine phosphatase